MSSVSKAIKNKKPNLPSLSSNQSKDEKYIKMNIQKTLQRGKLKTVSFDISIKRTINQYEIYRGGKLTKDLYEDQKI